MDFRSEEVVNLYEDHNLTAPDDLENKLSKSYKNIKSCIASTGEGTGSLNFNIEKLKTEAQSNYEQTVFGLTYLIFRKKTTNLHHQKIWQTLSLINKDNFSCFVKVYLNILGSVRFEKFSAKVNLFLCFKSLMATNTNGVNEVFFLVLRQLAGSNSSEENISWLTWILTTIELNQVWFSNLDLKLQSLALYTLLRFSLDLTVQVNLRKRLVTATVNILRGKFFDISMVIGRDLIRLLIEATDTNIPDLVKLLNDIIQKPNELDVRFQSIYQILAVPTPSDFFRSRLTPDMELKLMFILAQSKIFNYSKNFLWFQKQFLFQKEDEQLYSDLIRYILYCFHPSNSQLADKEAVPRYLLCWRFFNTMKHPPVSTININLHKNLILNSLFFDWYFFEPRNENLMGLEPGILLIERFLKDIPNVSNLLIQTLKYNFDRYSKYFDKTYLLDNLNKSMKILIDSGVIRSLNSIYNHRNLHQASKECLFELFSQFLIDKNTLQFPQLNSPSKLEETSGKFQQRQKMLSISDLVNNDSRENIYDFKFVESTIKEIEDFKFSSSKINNKFEELFNLVNKNEDNHQNTSSIYNGVESLKNLENLIFVEIFFSLFKLNFQYFKLFIYFLYKNFYEKSADNFATVIYVFENLITLELNFFESAFCRFCLSWKTHDSELIHFIEKIFEEILNCSFKEKLLEELKNCHQTDLELFHQKFILSLKYFPHYFCSEVELLTMFFNRSTQQSVFNIIGELFCCSAENSNKSSNFTKQRKQYLFFGRETDKVTNFFIHSLINFSSFEQILCWQIFNSEIENLKITDDYESEDEIFFCCFLEGFLPDVRVDYDFEAMHGMLNILKKYPLTKKILKTILTNLNPDNKVTNLNSAPSINDSNKETDDEIDLYTKDDETSPKNLNLKNNYFLKNLLINKNFKSFKEKLKNCLEIFKIEEFALNLFEKDEDSKNQFKKNNINNNNTLNNNHNDKNNNKKKKIKTDAEELKKINFIKNFNFNFFFEKVNVEFNLFKCEFYNDLMVLAGTDDKLLKLLTFTE